MKDNKQRICFYHPHRQTISGGLFYFYKLAEYCSKLPEYEAFVVNYENSKYTGIYKSTNTCDNLHFINYENTDGIFDENTIFFTYCNMLPLLLESFKNIPLGKIYLINFHPKTSQFLIMNLSVKKDKEKEKIFKLISDSNAMSFMDKACYDATVDFSNVNFEEKYIPAFIEKTNLEYQNDKLISENEINIGCVCRLDIDKIETVINFLNNIYNLNIDKTINVHIIGDGTHASKIDTKHYGEKFNLILTSYLHGEELKKYISTHIDMLFNFGIASLDAASMKLPVAIPIYDMKPHDIDRYYFLFDSKYYNLGCEEELVDKYLIKTYSLNEIIDMIYKNNKKAELGNQCYNYLIENHMVETSFKKFIKYAKESTLTINKCMELKSIAKTVNEFSKFRENGYLWDDYIHIRNLNLKRKIYRLICNLYNKNKKTFSKFDYKIYSHFAKRLKRRGVTLPTQKCEEFEASEIRKLYSKYEKVVQNLNEKIKNNQKIKVSFLVIFDSVFPAEPLYQKMLKDELFEPQIIVIPDISRGEDNMYIQMEKTYKTLSAKYKNVQKSWDEKHKKFIDFSKEMDIVCTANPYDGMTHKLYRIGKLSKKDILPIYFNYGYPAVLWARRVAALVSLSKMWKVFSESPATMSEYSNSMKTHGENLVLAGYMKMDNLAKQPIRKRERKTIIIAPHHTIEAKFRNSIGLSNFLEYAELFQELPKKYPQIDFIFRPHPLLRVTLAQNHIWGEEKTDEYFKNLEKNPNLTYQAGGDYFETFANSDGIIHDCSSFLAEYMFTGKPVCYMLKTKDSIDKFFMDNGKQILENCYKAFSKEEIYDYIDNVIIKGNDPMAAKREEFAKKELMVNYPNVSTFVLNYIKKELGVN